MSARHALVFGGSGQIGRPLLAGLQRDGWRITAFSRQPQSGNENLRWLRGGFDECNGSSVDLPPRVDAIFSCGPLDRCAQWYARSRVDAARVVAFSSTSIDSKYASTDPGERELAARLQTAEAGILAATDTRGATATLLRPTLVYGTGRDASLSRIARLARRHGWFALPRGAHGLRQPVHVDDLAAAALAALDSGASHGRAYALCGGETLAYRDMVARVLASLQPPPRLWELPGPLFASLLHLARISGRAGDVGPATVARMRADLVFDMAPAQRDLAYQPRCFQPTADMFDAGAFTTTPDPKPTRLQDPLQP